MLIMFSTQNIGKSIVRSNKGVVFKAKIPETDQINKFSALRRKTGSIWIEIPHLSRQAQDY